MRYRYVLKCWLFFTILGSTVWGFQDDFELPRDYLQQGVTGSGYVAWFAPGITPMDTVEVNSSLRRRGQLYLGSSNTGWAQPKGPRGPFLQRQVAGNGDFILDIQVTETAGTPDLPFPANRGGLQVLFLAADQSEETVAWLSLDYVPARGGNTVSQGIGAEVTTLLQSRDGWGLSPYLQIERSGVSLHFRVSRDGRQWESLPGSPLHRPELGNLPTLVGPYQACPQGMGLMVFDDFRVISADNPVQEKSPLTAHNPQPIHGGVTAVPVLRWQAGRSAEHHHLSIGTTPGILTHVATLSGGSELQYQSPEPFTPGTTYYWRVDQETTAGQIHVGSIWSFRATPFEAYSPWPHPDTRMLPTRDMVLTWQAGRRAVWHDIYLSPKGPEVERGAEAAYRGRWLQTRFQPGLLLPDTTYYWRVDAVEADGKTSRPGPLWSFTTQPATTAAPSDLVAWWPCDFGPSSYLVDTSGHQHHGRCWGEPTWVDGKQGLALSLDGIDDHVVIPQEDFPQSAQPFSLMAWIYPERHNHTLFWWGLPQDNRACEWRLLQGRFCRLGFWNNNMDFKTGDLSGEWHHLAATFDGDQRLVFLDGQQLSGVHVGTLNEAPHITATDITIGFQPAVGGLAFAGKLDDIRVYNRALGYSEVGRVMAGDPSFASDPDPASGVITAPEQVTLLQWFPGAGVLAHDLYLGTEAAAVRNADRETGGKLYQGLLVEPDYPLARPLLPDRTYYWRVDQYHEDGRLTRGTVWSFTLRRVVVVDDFEAYTDLEPRRIFDAWEDGYTHKDSGSTIGYLNKPYAEKTVVYDGQQSMPFLFNNQNEFFFSRTSRTYNPALDWLTEDVDTLLLQMHGLPENILTERDRLWIQLKDTAGQSYTGWYPNGTTDMQRNSWHEWSIPLDASVGVNLSAVKELHIGIGNPTAVEPGGRGTIFIDAIQLETRDPKPDFEDP